jgi:hypothetical protein
MSARAKSALDAMNATLRVLRERDRCSYAPLLRNPADRNELAQACADKVEQARNGNIEAAKTIIDDFVRSVRQHSKRSWCGPIHYVYARYLAEALQRVMDGDDARVALGVKSARPGRRQGSVIHDPKALAAGYWLLIRKGLAPEKSIELIGALTEADRTTVQSARASRHTKAFNRPNLVSDHVLKTIVAKQRFGKAVLKLLR